MAGPNPYKLHSFAELRAMFGPLWVRCDSCRRFRGLRITRVLRDRDTRTTRFKCSKCGGPGYCAIERPNTERGMEDYIDDSQARAYGVLVLSGGSAEVNLRFNQAFPWFDHAEWGWAYEAAADDRGPAYLIRPALPDARGSIETHLTTDIGDERCDEVRLWLYREFRPKYHVPSARFVHRTEGKFADQGHHRHKLGPTG